MIKLKKYQSKKLIKKTKAILDKPHEVGLFSKACNL